MRSPRYPINPAAPSPENLFSPAFLEILRERDEVLTASEAEFSGSWKCEPAPGRPGAVAVLREWESVDLEDAPEAVVLHDETALLLTIVLPAIEREPLFHLADEETPEGYAISSVFGQQGTQITGWLRQYKPEVVQALHIVDCIERSPAALAALLEAAGCTAIEQAGQILARRLAR
jgi:hypothetical protein